MRKLAFICLYSIISWLPSFAEEVSVNISAPSQVAVGERFRLVFSVNARPTEFRPPAFTDFRLISGPSQSTSSSTQIINNQVTTSFSISYSYVLEAINEGQFNIDPAHVTVDGSNYSSQSHAILVSGQAPAGTQAQPSPRDPSANIQQPGSQDIFVRAVVSNNNPYQFEQVILTYKLYTRISVSRYSIERLPSYQAFWSEDLGTASQPQPEIETLDGIQYNVVELKRTALFPQRAGELQIDPLAVEAVVRMRTQQRSGSIFDSFFGGTQDVPLTIRSNAVKLQVKPLPSQNKPAAFKGLVGQMDFSASLSPTEIQVNDAANLSLTISGKGNLRMTEKPEIQFPANLEVFDPNIEDQIRNERSGITGSRTFDFLIIPRTSGEYIIPEIHFTWFDAAHRQYVTKTAGPFTLNAVGPGGHVAEDPSGVFRADVQTLATDIRFIYTQSVTLRPFGSLFFLSRRFFLVLAIPFVLFVLVLIIGRREIRMRADQTLMRNRKAEKVARKRLRKAKEYLSRNEEKPFYDEVFGTLWGYLSDKFNIPVSKLNKEEVLKTFKEMSLTDDLAQNFTGVLQECEFARFAPAKESKHMDDIYRQASNAIVKLEKEFKNKRTLRR